MRKQRCAKKQDIETQLWPQFCTVKKEMCLLHAFVVFLIINVVHAHRENPKDSKVSIISLPQVPGLLQGLSENVCKTFIPVFYFIRWQ